MKGNLALAYWCCLQDIGEPKELAAHSQFKWLGMEADLIFTECQHRKPQPACSSHTLIASHVL